MTQFLYPEQLTNSNVTYGLLGTTALAGKKSSHDLSGHTVIIISDDFVDYSMTRKVADMILRRECQDIVKEAVC